MARVGLNIFDLAGVPEVPRMCMIAPVVPNKETVVIDSSRVDERAIILECPEDQAHAIVVWLQDHFGGHRKVRAYLEGPKGGWKSVTQPMAEVWRKQLEAG